MMKTWALGSRNGALAPHRRGFFGLLADALHRIGEWQRRQRDIEHLQALSDHQLKDIGISRSEIVPAVFGSGTDGRRSGRR